MTSQANSRRTPIVFVDLDNPPALLQLHVGVEIALIRSSGLCGVGISQLDVPAADFAMSGLMFTTAPLQPLPNQPVNTYVRYYGTAQKLSSGKITYVKAPLVPNPTNGTPHSINYIIT